MLTFSRDHFDTQILTRLHLLPGVTVFDLVVKNPPLLGDGSQRIAPYVVYQAPGGGEPTQVTLADRGGALVLRPIVKPVTAFRHETSRLLDAVQDLLYGWRPAAPEGVPVGVSPLRFPLGFEPGPIQVSRTETPDRFWLPLQFEFTVTT